MDLDLGPEWMGWNERPRSSRGGPWFASFPEAGLEGASRVDTR